MMATHRQEEPALLNPRYRQQATSVNEQNHSNIKNNAAETFAGASQSSNDRIRRPTSGRKIVHASLGESLVGSLEK
jgi:hypothetical protein